MSESLTKLQFPPEYFEREERSGHIVGELMKHVWAAELEMLAHVDEICQKYGLEYYAYWGTLLGAVRHRGFIPWDDDLDIAMKRDDYNKFLEVASYELPEEYVVLNNYAEEWDNVITKISNSHRFDFGDDYLKRNHNCPFAVGIDIFPLDYIPRDKGAAQQQKEILEYISNISSVAVGRKEEAAKGVAKETLDEYDRIIAENLVELEHICGIRFDTKRTIFQQLNILFDQVSGVYTKEESDELTSNFNYIKSGYKIPITLLEEKHRVSFENFTIPIPKGYDEILRRAYGKYMSPKKNASTHGDLYFRDQIEVLARALDERVDQYMSKAEEDCFMSEVKLKSNGIGKKKKIILMCNDTVGIITHDANVVKKIRHVMQICKQESDILLWWRTGRMDMPQMDVLQNLMPQLIEEYRELIKEFCEENIGFFDKGVSVDNALTMCDAYYGDNNELANKFLKAGKPVMILDYEILPEKR